jgi:ABC-type Zn uptake system ZnuABC Zn-binding protein ZnuA
MKSKILTVCILFVSLFSSLQAAELKICVSVPELGDLASLIGGKHVTIKTFVKGQEDPHALVARPSDVLDLSRADAFIVLGMAMEKGWAPALIDRSRNNKVQPGKPGYIDASSVIKPINDVPGGVVTRAMGDVHPEGNPHYMLDPINGLKIARLFAKSFTVLNPSLKQAFEKNLSSFEKVWSEKAFGNELVKQYGLDSIIELVEQGQLNLFLSKTNQKNLLRGWFGKMASLEGTYLVSDHAQWVYFGKRFNLKIEKALEPKPGVPAGSKYLKEVVDWMNDKKVKGVLTSPYFNPRHLAFVEKYTNAKLIPMAHQSGSRVGTDSYLSMIEHNVKQVCLCCKGR